MKKKTPAPKRATRRVTKSPSAHQTVVLHRIVIISACVVLAVVAAVSINRHEVTRAVAGASIVRGLFMQTTIEMPALPDAVSYNIYYRQQGEKDFTNAVRNVPASIPNYTISYLKKGVNYEYRFAAVDSQGKEYLFSETKPLTDLRPM